MGRTFIAVLALAASLIGVSTAASQSMVSADIVDTPRPIEQWGYAPRTLTVAPGTWVTWSNSGYDAHTVTDIGSAFDSGTLQPSEGFSWYFDQEGTFEYLCTLHDWMVGTVIVGSGLAPEAPTAPEEPTESTPEETVAPEEPIAE